MLFTRLILFATALFVTVGCACGNKLYKDSSDEITVLSIHCDSGRWPPLSEVAGRMNDEDLVDAKQESEDVDFWIGRPNKTYIIIYSSNTNILYSGLIDSFPVGSTVISLPQFVRGETIQVEFTEYRRRGDNCQYVFPIQIPESGNQIQELVLDVKWNFSGDAYEDFMFGKVPFVTTK